MPSAAPSIEPLPGIPLPGVATPAQVLAEVGPIWGRDIRAHGERVKLAYAPLLRAAAKRSETAVHVRRDIAFGAEPRQILDVFAPIASSIEGERSTAAPVVIFVHGGAFVRGEKSSPDGLYDNVLLWFASHGYVGVNLEYRLAPGAVFPAAVHDVAAGVEWTHDHIGGYGGDPRRIYLIGHSAGGTHVASYGFDPHLGFLGRHTQALALISARLLADDSPENPNAAGVRAYFGSDAAAHERCSPMMHAAQNAIPTFIAIAEFENPLLDVYGLEFAHRLAVARRRAPPFMQLAGHNHVSIVAHFNTDEDVLGRRLVAFFQSEETSGKR
ncbi:MAG: alpha/beta hydrolase [Variovorax sp.]